MPARKTDAPKRAVSLTLTATQLDELATLAGRHEYPPSLSQMVDKAIAEYIASRKPPQQQPPATRKAGK